MLQAIYEINVKNKKIVLKKVYFDKRRSVQNQKAQRRRKQLLKDQDASPTQREKESDQMHEGKRLIKPQKNVRMSGALGKRDLVYKKVMTQMTSEKNKMTIDLDNKSLNRWIKHNSRVYELRGKGSGQLENLLLMKNKERN